MSRIAVTDAELDLAIAAALKRAHEAPLGEYNLHADGTREIRNHTYAWAKESAEWMRLCDERDRRRRAAPSQNEQPMRCRWCDDVHYGGPENCGKPDAKPTVALTGLVREGGK